MNLVLLFEQDFVDSSRVILEGRRAEHIRQVHRANAGDILRAGLLNGNMGQATVVSVTQNSVELDTCLDTPPPPPLPLTLILALTRPKMLRRLYRTIAELGIKQVYLVNTWRVEKSFWQSPVLSQAHYTTYLFEGLEQARDTLLPRIEIRQRFKPFVEDELPQLIEGKQAIIAHPGLGSTHHSLEDSEVVLAIGPEGGFIPYEVEKLSALGFKGLDLGERIYRVENALSFAIAKLF